MTRSLPLAQAFLCPTSEGQWDRRNGTLFLSLLGAISITANILYALVEAVHWPEKRKKYIPAFSFFVMKTEANGIC